MKETKNVKIWGATLGTAKKFKFFMVMNLKWSLFWKLKARTQMFFQKHIKIYCVFFYANINIKHLQHFASWLYSLYGSICIET